MKNIVNIVNFVRGIEPRPGRDIDLVGTTRSEMEQMRKNGLNGTFLLQYDAIIDPRFVRLFEDCEFELGIWLEVVEPQVNAIGEKWRGRYPWDWHNDVGFLIGYEKEVRYRLIDEHMSKFRQVFGYYPKSIGSWHIDAASLKYFEQKYEIDACCICRDQVGVDGYTMQGGYYNGAYYPCSGNMFCPANDGGQINIPVFRMLGSDAIYAYDYQLKKDDYGVATIPTLEPASRYYGNSPWWIDSFFDNTFCGHGISHQYTQAGQENSFGWPRLGKGFTYQMEKLALMKELDIMTLGEAGRWYKEHFNVTPPQTLTALHDPINDRYKSVWYNSRYYRANLFWDDGTVRIRDMYIFNNELKEHCLDTPCRTTACEFRTCPVIDSALYGKDAGAYISGRWDSLEYSESDASCTVTLKNATSTCMIMFCERGIAISGDVFVTSRYQRELVYGKPAEATELYCSHNNAETVISSITSADVTPGALTFEFCGVRYGLKAERGSFTDDFGIIPERGEIVVSIL